MNNDEMCIGKKWLIAEFAKRSIHASPNYIPDNLEIILRKLSNLLPTYEFETSFGGKFIKKNDFNMWFENILTQIPEIRGWNTSKNKIDLYTLIEIVKQRLISDNDYRV